MSFFKRTPPPEPNEDGMHALLLSLAKKVNSADSEHLIALNKMSLLLGKMNENLMVFLERQMHVINSMEKFFHVQVELTEKQIKAIEEMQPTEDDRRF